MLSDAIVAVITNGDKILMIERAPRGLYVGFWAPVSGKVELGESQESAVARESLEEVGLIVRPVRQVWENVSTSGEYRLYWWLAEYVGGELKVDAREAASARWCTVEDISSLKIFEGDREFYQAVLPSLVRKQDALG